MKNNSNFSLSITLYIRALALPSSTKQPQEKPRELEWYPLASVAMASIQCYKPTYETCQQKCLESPHGHKVADMGSSWGMKENHQGHHGGYGYGMANTQTYMHGQNHAYYPDHNMAKTQAQYYGQTHSHYPEHTVSKTHEAYKYHSQTNGHGHPSDHHAMAHANYGHGQAYGHQASHGISMACQMKSEKKMKEKGSEYKKEKMFYKKKSKASRRSCSNSDGSNWSDSDWTWLHWGKARTII